MLIYVHVQTSALLILRPLRPSAWAHVRPADDLVYNDAFNTLREHALSSGGVAIEGAFLCVGWSGATSCILFRRGNCSKAAHFSPRFEPLVEKSKRTGAQVRG